MKNQSAIPREYNRRIGQINYAARRYIKTKEVCVALKFYSARIVDTVGGISREKDFTIREAFGGFGGIYYRQIEYVVITDRSDPRMILERVPEIYSRLLRVFKSYSDI